MASDVRASKKTSRTRKFSLGSVKGQPCGAAGLEGAAVKGIPKLADPDLRPPCAGELVASEGAGSSCVSFVVTLLCFSEKGFHIVHTGLDLPMYLRGKT